MSEQPPKVKICGLTRLADAELSFELGAWAVGMVFYEHSPRRCSIEEARRITASLRRKTELCGVFVNAPLERVVGMADELGLSMIQLHGDEGPAFCAEVRRRSGLKVCKAAQIGAIGDLQDIERFHVDYHLLDAFSSSSLTPGIRGGTGETFDWELLRGRRSHTPMILSGGLNASNVVEAIAATHPFAVDTASGTESAPGLKDEAKLEGFFNAVASTAPPAELIVETDAAPVSAITAVEPDPVAEPEAATGTPV